ncbi:coiled-coil domain-containing protein 115 [Hyposmocoma kahamanoa]|uniref:coiled-coil domain-containing protein 115 n=1 Tax=Hyposmocoma kahamanoa TaxID=1477025 RepID=UPI000E6D6649|nr:coiled-coil domain-containing protein 115 [Hyposmocoma kahamanoa]
MATRTSDDTTGPDMDTVCMLLDKITLKQLYLMEEKMRCELNIETSINNGSLHLAKSRYIMGHSSVSSTKLPVEGSAEFAASTVCETSEDDGIKQLKVKENNTENTCNPLRWFGILVPQNLHRAQHIFQNAINFVVECVNVQLQIYENTNNIKILNKYKKILEA